MTLFFFDEPIKESNHSFLNNSVLGNGKNHPRKEGKKESCYGYPLTSSIYPYLFDYPSPYLYPSHPQAANPSSASSTGPKANASGKTASYKQFSHAMDKDVGKLVDFRPKDNLCEDEKHFYIQLDLPGMTKDQIHMELSEDNILTITGVRENKYKKPGMMNVNKIVKMECEYGKFSRSFSIPETANLEQIEAKMENGVLVITIAKAEVPKIQRRTIQVQ